MEKILTKRDIESIKKKKKIYDTAMTLFKKYGYENVTMKTISKESGFSEGSIYHYYGEKAGILAHVMEESQAELNTLFPTEENETNNPKEIIYTYLCKELEIYEDLGRDLVRIIINLNQQSVECSSVADLMVVIQPGLTNYIKNCMEKGVLKSQYSADELSFLLTSEGSGLTNIWALYGGKFSLVKVGTRNFKILMDRLFEE